MRNSCYCLCNWNFTWWKGENSSTYFNAWTLTGLLAVRKFLVFPKTNKQFYHYWTIPLFFMCIVPVQKPTFIMILNRMIYILWQTAASVANGTTTSAWAFKLTFFEIKLPHAMEMLCLQKINYMKMKIRDLCVDNISVKSCAQCIVTINTWSCRPSGYPIYLGSNLDRLVYFI